MGPTYTIAYVTKQPVSMDRLLEVIRSAVDTKARRLGVEDLLVNLVHEGGGTPYRTTYAQAGIFGIELVHGEFAGRGDEDRSLANFLYAEGIAALADIGVHAVGISDK